MSPPADLNRVEFDIVLPTPPLTIRIYFDNGSGHIDYGRPIADVNTADCSPLAGYGGAGFGLTPFGASLGFAVGIEGIKLFITHRLRSGTYQFALVPFDAADNCHRPKIVTQTIATRPDELVPYIASYDAGNDVLILGG